MKMSLFFSACMASMLLCGCGERHVITVDRLRSMSKINVLYVSAAEVYKIETANGKTSLSRLVRGGGYYSIDLSLCEVSSKEASEGQAVTIRLPPPKVDPKPDPKRSVEFKPRVRIGYTDSALNHIREQYDKEDRKKITEAVSTSEYMRMAKAQAEKVLRDMLPELKLSVEWMD